MHSGFMGQYFLPVFLSFRLEFCCVKWNLKVITSEDGSLIFSLTLENNLVFTVDVYFSYSYHKAAMNITDNK